MITQRPQNDMDRPQWNSLGLCSGVGLLDLAVAIGCEHLGIDCRPAAACEWDAYAASVLLQRMEDQALESCPIWGGDMRDFDAKPFRGVVDVLAAGLPCQPYSVAGKQLGNSDKRSHGDDGDGPVPQFLRIVSECRPSVVFLENVPNWVRGGWFRPVGEELCRLGYTLEDPLFITAESVGASHRRERVFVLAYHTVTRSRKVSEPEGRDDATDAYRGRGVSRADSYVSSMRRALQGVERNGQSMPKLQDGKYSISLAFSAERGQRELRQSSERDGFFDGRDEAMEQSNGSSGRLDKQGRGSHRRTVAGRTSGDVADADEQGPQKRIGEQRNEREEFATAERGGSIFAPGPGADWRNVPAHLWPAVESGLRFVADGLSVVVDASRADQLRCAGNAVVPLQAAVAFVELMRRAEVTT